MVSSRSMLWIPLVGSAVLVGCRGDEPESAPAGIGRAAVVGRAECVEAVCEIEIRHVVMLSDSASPGLFGERVFIERDRAGRFLTSTLTLDRFAIFDSTGILVDEMGRYGEGPGEYRRAMVPLRGPADSLYAFDYMAGRLSVLSPDGAYVRSMQFPGMPAFVRDDGTFVLAAQLRTRDQLGYPVHLLDADGVPLRSFGMDVPQYRADMRRAFTRIVGRGHDGTIWTAPPGRWEIEQWDPDAGERLRRVPTAPPEWFTESSTSRESAGLVEPDPILSELWEDEFGFLWILARVPDAEREALYTEEPPPGPTPREDWNRMYDWRLEVIDPDSGRRVASRLLREEIWTRSPHRYLVSPAGIRGDGVRFEVSRPILSRKETRQ